jgi:DNA helicase-2/ATP-dependent DNA helicase PcrA
MVVVMRLPDGRLLDGRLLNGLDDAQREAVTTPAAPLCVLAGAGSGKTRVLTRRIAYRVSTGQADPARTLAITFSRRAAVELRGRLYALGLGDHVDVGTIHSRAFARLRTYWADHGKSVPRVIDNSVRRLTDLEKRRRGVIDFDDLLIQFAETVRADQAFADAVRWFSRHIYVDEFQDVTPAQFHAVMAWLGDRDDLCVVGDPNQSIYGWNGADPTLLTSLPDRLPALHTVRLDANYRSSPAIVRAAAAVLGQGDAPPAAHDRSEEPTPVTVTGYRTPDQEVAGIARSVRLAHPPQRAWSDIAVLARTNAYLDPIADALLAAGIPCRIVGRVNLLSRPAVREGLKRLTRTVAAADEASRLRSLAHDYADPADQAALHEVAELAREFDTLSPGASTAAFIDWLPTTQAADAVGMTSSDAVQLATFHKAKGLEWPVVFVAGASAGHVPLEHGDIDEERRLLYVAMTRAERELHLSHIGPKSPFLPDDLVAADPPCSLDAAEVFAGLRRVLADAAAADAAAADTPAA